MLMTISGDLTLKIMILWGELTVKFWKVSVDWIVYFRNSEETGSSILDCQVDWAQKFGTVRGDWAVTFDTAGRRKQWMKSMQQSIKDYCGYQHVSCQHVRWDPLLHAVLWCLLLYLQALFWTGFWLTYGNISLFLSLVFLFLLFKLLSKFYSY